MADSEGMVHVAEEAFARLHSQEIPITIVGDLILDTAVEGKPGGTHPETGVDLLKDSTVQEGIGGAGNVSLILSRLGAQVSLFSIVGGDLPGRQLLEMQERQRYESHLVTRRDWPSPRKEWIYERSEGQVRPRLRLDYDQPLPADGREELLGEFRARRRRDTRVLVVADHGLGALGPETGQIIDLAKELSAKVVAVPRTPLDQYQRVHTLVPNPTEMRALVGLEGKGPARQAADSYSKEHKLNVFLTQGVEGIYLAVGADSGESQLVPTQPVDNPQKMGARDMVLAITALGSALDLPPVDIAQLANGFARLVVMERGNGVVYWDDLFRSLGRKPPSPLAAKRQ